VKEASEVSAEAESAIAESPARPGRPALRHHRRRPAATPPPKANAPARTLARGLDTRRARVRARASQVHEPTTRYTHIPTCEPLIAYGEPLVWVEFTKLSTNREFGGGAPQPHEAGFIDFPARKLQRRTPEAYLDRPAHPGGCQTCSTGTLRFRVFSERFTGPLFLDFVRRLIAGSPGRKIVLIVDGHPAHRAKIVREWIAQHPEQIELHYLPGPSPELNPAECLNQDVNANALGRRRPRSLTQLAHEVRSYLRSRQRQPGLVARYFHERHVTYAAAPAQ
jgi:transposase